MNALAGFDGARCVSFSRNPLAFCLGWGGKPRQLPRSSSAMRRFRPSSALQRRRCWRTSPPPPAAAPWVDKRFASQNTTHSQTKAVGLGLPLWPTRKLAPRKHAAPTHTLAHTHTHRQTPHTHTHASHTHHSLLTAANKAKRADIIRLQET